MTDAASTEKVGAMLDAVGFTGWLEELEAAHRNISKVVKTMTGGDDNLLAEQLWDAQTNVEHIIALLRSRSSNARDELPLAAPKGNE
jgi:hypothetical protein